MISLGKKLSSINTTIIGKKSSSMTPLFLTTFEIFNMHVHNCLVDSEASSNVIPYSVCKKLKVEAVEGVVGAIIHPNDSKENYA